MLHVDEISVSIGNASIVRDVSFRVSRGELFALIGPNGSGKSTILKTISRILTADSGRISVDGRPLDRYRPKDYARKVSSVAQHSHLIDGLTVREMASYGRLPHRQLFRRDGESDRRIIDSVLEEVDLSIFSERMASSLSGGELQRVHLAASFVQEPQLLLLDEPTNHLDVRHQYNLLHLVKRRVESRGLAVVCVLHDINQAARFADRIAILQDGQIRHIGPPGEVISESTIASVFGIPARIHRGETGPLVEFSAGSG